MRTVASLSPSERIPDLDRELCVSAAAHGRAGARGRADQRFFGHDDTPAQARRRSEDEPIAELPAAAHGDARREARLRDSRTLREELVTDAERSLRIDPMQGPGDPQSSEQGLLDALEVPVPGSRKEVAQSAPDAETAPEAALVADVEAVVRQDGEGSQGDDVAACSVGSLLRFLARLGRSRLLRRLRRGREQHAERRGHSRHHAAPTAQTGLAFHVVVSCLVAQACSPLPDVRYETDRLEIAPEFDHPICAGTLEDLDAHVGEASRSLGLPAGRIDPLRVYWMADGLSEFCREGSRGCFFPGTRVLFARGSSVGHEIVHALLDSGGETFFVEEGMAEVFSGASAAVELELDALPLLDGLSLSRADYRAGSLDYAAATHFVRWVYATKGVPAMLRLSKEIRDDADGSRLRRTVEDIYGESIDAVEARYVSKAPSVYPGLYEEKLPVIDLGEARQGLERRLDCEAPGTQGPLWDDRAGMFRAEHLVLPRSGDVRIEVSGDSADTWVLIFDPYARDYRPSLTPWRFPDPAIDRDALKLEAGVIVERHMKRGSYLVVFGSDDPSRPATPGLRIELARPDDPGTEKHP